MNVVSVQKKRKIYILITSFIKLKIVEVVGETRRMKVNEKEKNIENE